MAAVLAPTRPLLADHQRMLRLADEQVEFNTFERDEKIRTYRAKLSVADWFYEFCDSHDAYMAGRREFDAIYALQEEVDPCGVIWREAAPAAMSSGMPIPQPRVRSAS